MLPRLEACRSGIKSREFACEFSGLNSGWPNDPGAPRPPYRPTAPLNLQPEPQAARFPGPQSCRPESFSRLPGFENRPASSEIKSSRIGSRNQQNVLNDRYISEDPSN